MGKYGYIRYICFSKKCHNLGYPKAIGFPWFPHQKMTIFFGWSWDLSRLGKTLENPITTAMPFIKTPSTPPRPGLAPWISSPGLGRPGMEDPLLPPALLESHHGYLRSPADMFCRGTVLKNLGRTREPTVLCSIRKYLISNWRLLCQGSVTLSILRTRYHQWNESAAPTCRRRHNVLE